MANRRLIQEVVREMREHREECNDRYEETARDQAKFGTTLTQVVDTLRRVDERTQTTHDQVTALRVLVNNK